MIEPRRDLPMGQLAQVAGTRFIAEERKPLTFTTTLGATWHRCPFCNGNSAVPAAWPTPTWRFLTSDYYPACKGKGGKWRLTI